MAITAKNRKKAEKLVLDTLMKLEPGGLNAKRYKELFASMSDAQFVAYWKRIKEDPSASMYVETDLYGKNVISMDDVENACEFLGVPTEEYYYIQHKGDVPIRSKKKVPVMYIHLKRMQQLLSKKVRTNVDIDSGNVRSRLTGGLNSSSKTGRFTDADTQALVSITSETMTTDIDTGAEIDPIVFELLTMRGDNAGMRSSMLQQIAFNGELSIANIAENAPVQEPGQAVKTLDMYYLAAGLSTDLIDTTVARKGNAYGKGS